MASGDILKLLMLLGTGYGGYKQGKRRRSIEDEERTQRKEAFDFQQWRNKQAKKEPGYEQQASEFLSKAGGYEIPGQPGYASGRYGPGSPFGTPPTGVAPETVAPMTREQLLRNAAALNPNVLQKAAPGLNLALQTMPTKAEKRQDMTAGEAGLVQQGSPLYDVRLGDLGYMSSAHNLERSITTAPDASLERQAAESRLNSVINAAELQNKTGKDFGLSERHPFYNIPVSQWDLTKLADDYLYELETRMPVSTVQKGHEVTAGGYDAALRGQSQALKTPNELYGDKALGELPSELVPGAIDYSNAKYYQDTRRPVTDVTRGYEFDRARTEASLEPYTGGPMKMIGRPLGTLDILNQGVAQGITGEQLANQMTPERKTPEDWLFENMSPHVYGRTLTEDKRKQIYGYINAAAKKYDWTVEETEKAKELVRTAENRELEQPLTGYVPRSSGGGGGRSTGRATGSTTPSPSNPPKVPMSADIAAKVKNLWDKTRPGSDFEGWDLDTGEVDKKGIPVNVQAKYVDPAHKRVGGKVAAQIARNVLNEKLRLFERGALSFTAVQREWIKDFEKRVKAEEAKQRGGAQSAKQPAQSKPASYNSGIEFIRREATAQGKKRGFTGDALKMFVDESLREAGYR